MLANIRRQLSELSATAPDYAAQFVEAVLVAARKCGASDVHLQPTAAGLRVRWRWDGVLHDLGCYSPGESSDVVARLKVLSHLLTYRRDTPQEGRIPRQDGQAEMRVATFPTLHGERAVVRLFASSGYRFPEDLGFPEDLLRDLLRHLQSTSGALLLTGPAGSGKSTTAYACLRELVRQSHGARCLMTLEDPIEVALDDVIQAEVNRGGEFSLATGLRSLLRQDPEVVMIGEIRDRETAEAVFAASLTGHLTLSTFHAGSAASAVSRLTDMDIEPYLLRSGLLAIFCQRLVRRLCQCAEEISDDSERLGVDATPAWKAVGCQRCSDVGYQGRAVLVEMLEPAVHLRGRELISQDAAVIEAAAIEAGMIPCWQRAARLVQRRCTSPLEVRRILGFSSST